MGFNKFKNEIKDFTTEELIKLLETLRRELIIYNNPKFKVSLWNPQANRSEVQYSYRITKKKIAIIKTRLA